MSDSEYEKFVRDNASKTQMYNDILSDLAHEHNSNRCKMILAKDEDDYARIEIWTNYLAKYIIRLVNKMISTIWEENGREESEDWIREKFGLAELQSFNNNIWFAKWKDIEQIPKIQ